MTAAPDNEDGTQREGAAMRKLLVAGVITVLTLTGLSACDSVANNPSPTVTVTATPPTQTVPAPTQTVTVTPTPALPHLLPTDDDIANLAYRSGMAGPTTQFTVPATGYQILYICYPDPRGDATGAAGYEDENEGGSHNSGTLLCDSKIHILAADAAYVKKVGAVNKLTVITLTGDRMFVRAIDMSIRPLPAK